ncbi:unnamed protein product, partial [Polarella glacialis]
VWLAAAGLLQDSTAFAWLSAPRLVSPTAGSVRLGLAAEQPKTASSGLGATTCALSLALGASLAALGARRQSRSKTRLFAARLHGSQQTRSPLVNWYCYEADIPLEMRDPRPSPHPFGQVPCLVDDGGVEIFESGAILLYLMDKYGGINTPEDRAKYTKWVVFANATLESVCFGHKMSGAEIAKPGRTMDKLEEILSNSEYLVDNTFSVADVAVCSYLNYVPVFFGGQNMSRRPNVAAYMKRCASRPAFVKAFGQGHAEAVMTKIQG